MIGATINILIYLVRIENKQEGREEIKKDCS